MHGIAEKYKWRQSQAALTIPPRGIRIHRGARCLSSRFLEELCVRFTAAALSGIIHHGVNAPFLENFLQALHTYVRHIEQLEIYGDI